MTVPWQCSSPARQSRHRCSWPRVPREQTHAVHSAACRARGGSSPAEFVQPVVVDAEVVRDLVDHRDRDLVDDLVLGVATRAARRGRS